MEEIIEALEPLFIHPDRVKLSSETIGISQFEVRGALLDEQHNVAVKLIPFSSISGDKRLLATLKKEVLAMKECESEFVVQLMGVCLWEREVGIVMEQMAGSLSAYAYGSHRLTLSYEQVVGVALKIAQGLELLHEKGFVHRDVKPENILVNSSVSEVKWTDFGLASALLTSIVATKTNIGAGTPHFMSPEQSDPTGTVTRATDVWSLGCVFLCLLTGDSPWPVDWNALQLVTSLLTLKKTPTIPDSIPSEMQTLLRRCLTWEAKDRPTASQVVSILREMVLAGGAVVSGAQSSMNVQGDTPQQSRSVHATKGGVQQQQLTSPQSDENKYAATTVLPVHPTVVVATPSSSSSTVADSKTTTTATVNTPVPQPSMAPHNPAGSDSDPYEMALNHLHGRGGCKKNVRKGARLLQQASEMGHPLARCDYGLALFHGLYFLEQNQQLSIMMFTQEAGAGNLVAEALSVCYRWGSYKQYHRNRLQMLQSLKEKDAPVVVYHLGQAYHDNGDKQTAFECWKTAAEGGYALAQVAVGECYLNGRETPVDTKAGIRWLYLALEQGCGDAAPRLARCYETGDGVEEDLKKVIELYKLAKVLRVPASGSDLSRLGVSDDDDQGVLPKNAYIMVQTLIPAESTKERILQSAHNYIHGRGGCEKDVRQGLDKLNQAAEMGHPRAMFEWAATREHGLYFTDIVESESEKMYLEAAVAGEPLAIAYCHYKGLGAFEQNESLFAKMVMSIEDGEDDPWVMYYRGEIHMQGIGGYVVNEELAARFYEAAAKMGHAISQYQLGKLFMSGRIGGCVDLERAGVWFQLSLAQGYDANLER